MRIWSAALVVLAASLALSGCIGGHVTGVSPRGGNATFSPADGGADGVASWDADEQPPWVIKDAGVKNGTSQDMDGDADKDADSTKPGSDGSSVSDGTSDAGGSGSGGSGGSGSGGSGTPDPEPEPDTAGSDDPDLIGDTTGDMPTEGASGSGDGLVNGVDDTLDDATTDQSKDPLAGAGSVAGTGGLLG